MYAVLVSLSIPVSAQPPCCAFLLISLCLSTFILCTEREWSTRTSKGCKLTVLSWRPSWTTDAAVNSQVRPKVPSLTTTGKTLPSVRVWWWSPAKCQLIKQSRPVVNFSSCDAYHSMIWKQHHSPTPLEALFTRNIIRQMPSSTVPLHLYCLKSNQKLALFWLTTNPSLKPKTCFLFIFPYTISN